MNDYLQTIFSWAGGKVHTVDRLVSLVPHDYHKGTYREPFLGGGSLFFALSPRKATLSDLNDHLIHCYQTVRDNPELVNHYLKQFANHNSEIMYYKVRDEYNLLRRSIKQAARFIYLNKTSFNGIFRVNKSGKYNVPYGKKLYPNIPTLNQLLSMSAALKKAYIRAISYEKVVEDAKRDDFIYLDPPYPPLNGTSNFTHYTKERFGENDQIRVARVAKLLDKRGCRVMISNADIQLIRNLYSDWNQISLPVTRWITCKSVKHKVNELVITNYPTRTSRATTSY